MLISRSSPNLQQLSCPFFLKIYLFFMCVCVCVVACMHVHHTCVSHMCSACRGRREQRNPGQEPPLSVTVQVPGIEPASSRKAASALNCEPSLCPWSLPTAAMPADQTPLHSIQQHNSRDQEVVLSLRTLWDIISVSLGATSKLNELCALQLNKAQT